MSHLDNRKKEFMESRRSKKKQPQRKTEYEKRQTREEVEQIKKDLINYAKTSWGKEWIYSNLQIGRPFRMQRGIEYANDEQRIENVTINEGQIFATVQGTAPTPYRVKINFETINEADWKIIITKLAEHPLNFIELLEGNLPQELITVFEETSHSLFPNALKGLDANCSCPDKAIPCKHIASVILYLSRVIDFNPFLLLELRGKSKNELLDEMSLKGGKSGKKLTQESTDSKDISLRFSIPKITELKAKKKEKEGHNFNFNIKNPSKIIETVENLGNPPNLESKAFEIVLKAIYRKISSKSYEFSLDQNQ